MSIGDLLGCDRGVVEPYSDLPAVAIATIGFIVFTMIIGATYWSYAAAAYSTDQYNDALFLLNQVRTDERLTYSGRADLLDAAHLDYYEAHPGELGITGSYKASVVVEAGTERWVIGPRPEVGCVTAGHGVNVRMNSAHTVPGTLYVALWGDGL